MRNNWIYSIVGIFTISIFILSCQSNEEIEYAHYYVNGKTAYETHCQNCHGAKGEGLGLLYPPLTDTAFIAKNKNNLASIIKYGMSGELIINGQSYNGEMPAETHLSPIEITYIINYIGNSFGNKIGHYTQEQVQQDLINARN
ncbi:c-type cytochrome [Albibacterium bauzanense]|uniref:Cbb3-type cytochrome c oxidase subunit III n=1 Tax=Albibacterium bauzanense TaxID=653929 RepID=A0A4R1M2N0_9SPHI|nr:cytochrome c [Albibacterium bauzanense]TCK85280.1 cbb3-type cytochrome c oxidase subunit III [Albibacterium bauzanense]